jgi:hypothetical protein
VLPPEHSPPGEHHRESTERPEPAGIRGRDEESGG